MRRGRVAALLLAGAVLCGAGCYSALAAEAGEASNPLISLDWIKNTYIPQTVAAAETRIDAGVQAGQGGTGAVSSPSTELRVKRGDVLRLDTGASLTVLAGSLSGAASGAIVDLTEGRELSSGAALSPRHRYLAVESTKAAFSVTSDTAVVRTFAAYDLQKSAETDYNALADALKAMGMFKGSDLGYGSGFELENAPTRIQGLILFLRLLGEENAALRYAGTTQTGDVAAWAVPYVRYAYDRGYTKGTGVTAAGVVYFEPDSPLKPNDYVTFLLRALGYADQTDFAWLTAVSDAQKLGVLTSGETYMLQNQAFLRAQAAYLSYFVLSATEKGTETTLLAALEAKGTIDPATARTAMSGVTVKRL